MKKLLIPFLLLAALLTFVRIGFALTGSTYQPNVKQLLVDGDMEATNTQPSFVNLDFEGAVGPPPASWSQYQAVATRAAGTRTGGSGSYVAHVAYDTVNASGLMYQNGLTAGHTYRVTGWYRTDGIHMLVMLGPSSIIFNDTAASWTYFDATGIQVGGDNYLRFQSNDFNLGAGYFELDDVSVTDVTAAFWSPYNANTLVSKTTTNPHSGRQAIRSTRLANGGYTGMTQTILTVGKRYHVTGFARGSGGADIPWIAVGGYSNDWTGTNSTSWQRFDFTIEADGNVLFLLAVNGAINDYVEFDDVFVTEVTGYTQVQDTQTLVDGDMEGKPIALADAAMEAAGTASWTALSGATLSKQTTSPHGGSQLLRVARNGANVFYAYQGIMTVGHTYHVTGYARSDGTTTPRVSKGSAIVWTGTTATSWQSFDVTFTQDSGTSLYFGDQDDSSGYVEFDDLSVVDVGTTAWQAVQSVLSKQITSPHGGNQVIRVAYNDTNADGYAIQSILTLGKRYRMTGWMRGDGTSYPQVYLGGGGAVAIGTASTAWQRFDVTRVADLNTLIDLASVNLSTGHYVEFDDVTVTEDKGKQQVINKQVIVEGDMEGLPVALADAAMEAAGTGSWTPSQATLSKQTTNPHGGSQVLRVAYDGNPAHTAGEAYQSGVLTAGRTYRLTGWARADSGGVAYPIIMDAETTPVWIGVPGNVWQYIDTTFVAAGGTYSSFIEPYAQSIGAAGRYAEFDDLSIVDIGTSAWTPGSSNATLTKSTASPHGGKYALRAAWGSGTYVYASGGAIFTPGKKYRMTGWVRSDGAVTPTISISGGYNVWVGTTATSWQKIDVTFTPLYNSLYLLYQASSPAWVEWDDLYATLAE
ncbi:MAG: hypothetical protein WC750_04350 [Patescibacteria group bacterium]|jgi:hypothetical protein